MPECKGTPAHGWNKSKEPPQWQREIPDLVGSGEQPGAFTRQNGMEPVA